MTENARPKAVLFVCVENSNRSQMAEGFARALGAGKVEAFSAGSNPRGKITPQAVESMRELGIDISTQQSKGFGDLPRQHFDYVVTMGCGDVCPFVPGQQHFDWDLPDPKNLNPREFSAVRDEIKKRAQALLDSLI